MKKAILISIRPEWVKKILNGEKTIEIRKTAPSPKCELPIDVYIYCSHGKRGLYVPTIIEKPFAILDTGFVWLPKDKYVWKAMKPIDGKIVAKFTLKKVDEFDIGNPYEESTRALLDEACVTISGARKYAGGKRPYYLCRNTLYAWYISDLEVFDNPKKLSEFGRLLYKGTYSKADYLKEAIREGMGEVTVQQEKLMAEKLFSINRAPQSWQYVEVKE